MMHCCTKYSFFFFWFVLFSLINEAENYINNPYGFDRHFYNPIGTFINKQEQWEPQSLIIKASQNATNKLVL